MANRLADETSPYLLQHKDNPVDWRPWGAEALGEARERDVPLLVSIGYSACHWCHVMERETFEDGDVAAYMNEHFVCVKVDREERPSLDAAVARLREDYDRANGGWNGAPKFPAASVIDFLLRRGETDMSLHTLRAMAAGGINDQVGGGFARYAVDATWTVPHFEKMLYDNALLARAYLHGFQVSGDPVLRRTCEETLDFLARELRGPEGGFAS